MSYVSRFNEGHINPLAGAAALKYRFEYLMHNPTYFDPDGIWVFCGAQGMGKTISAVNCARQMAKAYPLAKVCTNIDFELDSDNEVIPFDDYSLLAGLDNGIEGLIFVLDEVHVLWNSLESKSIPISDMAALCQMRKSRRVILGTSQVYGRIAKPIREQLKYVIQCHCYFGCFQYNVICDPTESVEHGGVISPARLGVSAFFHTPELYRAYRTLDKVERVSKRSVVSEVFHG